MSEASWETYLAGLAARNLRRTLRRIETPQGPVIEVDGRHCVNFASNDYLGLAGHERVREAACQAINKAGWGAGASRLVAGTFACHLELEERLARFLGYPTARVFGSGYLANLAAVRAGAGKGDVIFSDERNHASLIDGARLSGARIVVFPHRDYDALDLLLAREGGSKRKLIVSESLFSADGVFAALPRLVELKRQHGAALCVDEAHAIGVYGLHGRGLGEMQHVEGQIDLLVGTLSKAFGGIGGFVCGSHALGEFLLNTARPFIFSTAPPPAACAAALAALEILEKEPERRRKLLALSARLRMELGDLRGHDLAGSSSQIIPLVLGDAGLAVELSNRLLDRGIFAPPFRPPSVPPGSSRLRVSMTAAHEPAHAAHLVSALDEVLPARRP